MTDPNSKFSKRRQRYRSSRRTFLKQAAAASLAISEAGNSYFVTENNHPGVSDGEIPWYRRITRWGQTNITEKDPQAYDISWWRNHWKRTRTQGVIINAGGIIAY